MTSIAEVLFSLVLFGVPPALAIVGGARAAHSEPGARSTVYLDATFETLVAEGGLRTDRSDCSGVLIGDRTILTAAHCVLPEKSVTELVSESPLILLQKPMFARARKIEVIFPQLPGRRFAVGRIATHPEYRIKVVVGSTLNSMPENDLAVLRLEENAPAGIPRIELLRDILPNDGTISVSVLGYGATSMPKLEAYRVQGNGLLRVVKKTGSPRGKNLVFNQRDGRGFCRGDSGGPDVVLRNGRTYVAGIHSTLSEIPAQLQRSERRSYSWTLTGRDFCAYSSISIFIPNHVDWIQSHREDFERN